MKTTLLKTSAGWQVLGPAGSLGLVERDHTRRGWISWAGPRRIGPYGTPGECAQALVAALHPTRGTDDPYLWMEPSRSTFCPDEGGQQSGPSCPDGDRDSIENLLACKPYTESGKVVGMHTRVVVELLEGGTAPRFANPSDACADCTARERVVIPSGQTARVPLGFRMQLQLGWEGQVRGRAGIAETNLLVHPGTVDHLYRLEVGCVLHNLSGSTRVVEAGDMICQLAVRPVAEVEIVEGPVEASGRGGFGSTGLRKLAQTWNEEPKQWPALTEEAKS